MKLGIFGDSFADINIDKKLEWPENFGWPMLLSKKLNCETDFHARCGTSTWYSYEKFLERYTEYTHIVFTYTYQWRWPYLPPDLGMNHWLYHSDTIMSMGHIDDDTKRILCKLSDAYNYVFNDKLLEFISKNVVKNVNKICQDNNIKLVNVFVDNNVDFRSNYDKQDLLFSTLEDLYYVSKQELINVNGKSYTMQEICSDFKKMDCRYCHFYPENNRIVANKIFDLFGKNEFVSTHDMTGWVYTDPKIDNHYRTVQPINR